MRLSITLEDLAADFADALKSIDADRLAHKHFAPGFGPYGETEAVRAALSEIQKIKPSRYADGVTKRVPDLLIAGQWAVEFKIVRPFGDNGRPAEHWSENVLHPYEGNTSAIGDCLRLLNSGLDERKAVIIFGYEHTPPCVALDAAIRGFEVLAREVMGLRLTHRVEELRDGLVHPVHQQLRVFGYDSGEAILDEVFKPGDHLGEVELSEKFEVSRSPVREALLTLEKEGTVISVRTRGRA